MAYTETDAGSGLDNVFDNSYITKSELYAILDQLKEQTRFYELEVFEVVEIDENPAQVVGRYVFSEQGDSIDEIDGRTFLPLNSNILQYPLRGELWLGMSYKGQHYYLARLSENIDNINFEKFNESSRVPIQTTELYRGRNVDGSDFVDIVPITPDVSIGDTLVQGRFNNYLKIGNTENTSSIEIRNSDSSLFQMTNEKKINLFSENDINIQSVSGDVNIQSDDKITLKPTNSTIEFDIKESGNGKIVNITNEGVPFPELNLAGFMKQINGVKKVFEGLQAGVPLLPSPFGIKKIVEGLKGAKDFIDATINLEFLDQDVLTTRTLGELQSALPIPEGFGNIITDVTNITDEQLSKVDKLLEEADKLKQKNDEIRSAINLTDEDEARNLFNNFDDSIPGVSSIKEALSITDSDTGWQNFKDTGGLDEFDEFQTKTENTANGAKTIKSYKNLFNRIGVNNE
jgi:hypothetical protein